MYNNNSPMIYVVETATNQPHSLHAIIENDGYRVCQFSSLDDFCNAVPDTEQPAAVVLHVQLLAGDTSAADAITALREKCQQCPPVVFLSDRDDIQARLAAIRSGACRYLVKPVANEKLLSVLDQLTLKVPTRPYRVLLVDDDREMLAAEAEVLSAAGMDVHAEDDPIQAYHHFGEIQPDVLVLDVDMPEVTGPELAALLMEDANNPSLPVLFLSAESHLSQQLPSHNLNLDDFLVKPVNPAHLVQAVTARARLWREVRHSQQTLKQALYEKEREHLALNEHAIVSIANVSGQIVYVNNRFCETSGYSRDELIGQNHRIVKSDEHSPEFYREMWHTIANGQIWNGEVCNRRKDGSRYWVESTIVPFVDDKGKPYQYISIRTDITDVKENEEALRAVMVSSTSLSSDAFFRTSVEWLARALRSKYAFIAQPHELDDTQLETVAFWGEGQLQENFVYPVAGTPCEHVLKKGQATFTSHVAQTFPEDEWLVKNSIESYVAVAMKDPQGRAIGHIGVLNDRPIHEVNRKLDLLRIFASRVGAEIARCKFEKELRESDERLRRSQVFANIGTWDWNIQSGELYWSERIAPLFGYQEGELETTYENFLEAVHPADRDAVTSAVGACVERGEEYNIEHRVVWPDGQVRWVHEKGDVVRDDNSNPLRMLGVVMDIHNRKMAEMAQAVSEHKFRNLFELSPVGIALNDMEGHFLEANQALLDAIGYSQEEYRSLSYWDLTPEKYAADEKEQLDNLNTNGRYGPYEKEYIHKDGSLVPVLLNGVVVTDESGEKRIWSIVQDISERKRAERTIEESREKLIEAQRLAKIGNWEADLVSGKLIWSDTIYEIFGFNKKTTEPSVNLFKECVHPADRELVEASEQQARETGRHDVIHRIIRPDNTVRYVHELATTICNEKGEVVGLAGTVQDVTELKRAEQELIIFRQIFDTSVQGIGVTDAEGALLYANRAHDEMHGYAHGETLGKHFSDFLSEETIKWVGEAIMGNIGQGKAWSGLLPVLRPDGTEVTTMANVGFVAAEDGTPQYLYNIMSDYSDELLRQKQLSEAKEAAERASQAKSEFLSSMSHELRTPMNAILGFSQILEYDDSLGDEQKDSVHEIIKAGRHLLDLINEVLDLAKIESGRIDLSLEPVKLADLVLECSSLIKPVATEKGIDVNLADMDGYYVRADRTRLKQVLLNLLSNAIKYNREKGAVSLEAVRVDDDRLCITITDTGYGVDGEDLEKMFEPFNRLNAENSEIEGTGIGLSITRRLTEMMGGEIEVSSQVGVGSKFSIMLPEEGFEKVEHFELGENLDETIAEQVPVHMHTILYIEDNPANLKLVSQILAKRHHIKLLTAHEPELGLELASVHRPDLILLDINMPRMDGYQVLSVLMSDTNLKNTPVIAITANAMPRDIERGMQAGFASYMTKPLDVMVFLKTIDKYLNSGEGGA